MEDHELPDFHSPRQKFQLTQELEHINGDVPFDGQNPFSYNQASHSSEEEEHISDPGDSLLHHEQFQLQYMPVPQNAISSPSLAIKSHPDASTNPIQQKTQLQSNQNTVFQNSQPELLSKQPSIQSKQIGPQLQLQSKYQQELASDMQQLQSSLHPKDKKKVKIFDSPKQQPRSLLNKTFSGRRGGSEAEMEAEQMRMLIKMSFEKKKANYQMLEEWDRGRVQEMRLHEQVINRLQSSVDLRINTSLQSFQHYQTFFRERALQEEKFTSCSVVDTRQAFQKNSSSMNVYSNCSLLLHSFSDQNLTRCRRIAAFVQLIRYGIIRDLTEAHLTSTQKELFRVRQKITTLRAALNKDSKETQQKTMELDGLFKQQAANVTGRIERDFYRSQLSFLRSATHQIQIQKKLGEYCLEYYLTAIEEERKRSNVLRQALLAYARGLHTAYQLPTDCNTEPKEDAPLIQQYFSVEGMLQESILHLLKGRLGITRALTIQDLKVYIGRFGYGPFDSRILLLKEFPVHLVTQGKGKEVGEEPCYLAITVDNFIHLTFGSDRNHYSRPDVTIKINKKGLEVRSGKDQMADIVKREEKRNSVISYFWDSKSDKVYRVKFPKTDNKEEFLDYITKLINNNY